MVTVYRKYWYSNVDVLIFVIDMIESAVSRISNEYIFRATGHLPLKDFTRIT